MTHSSYIVLDFETTGLNPEEGDRITEVGLVRVVDGHVSERFESLVDCGVRVPAAITAYTGITQQMVEDAPLVGEVMRQVAVFIGETPVVAHNADLDQRFFLRECRRQRIGMLMEPFICTMRLSRRIYPHLPGHSLAELARSLALPATGKAHRALADAELTAQLFVRLTQDVTAMHEALVLTPRLLRQLMHIPVGQLRSRLERLCA